MASPARPHLRSSLQGAAASPRPSSPRYLQATSASRAHAIRPGAPLYAADASALPPAGGGPNSDLSTMIDFDSGQGRTLRRSSSFARRAAPATIAAIAAPPTPALPEAPPRAAPSLARHRPPRAPGACTHDKGIPNSRRSQRARGTYQPGPAITTVSALAASEAMLITDAGYASNPIGRKAQGTAHPKTLRSAWEGPSHPMPDSPRAPAPPRVSAPSPSARRWPPSELHASGYIGRASGSEVDNLLGGRRARGACSPRAPSVPNLLAWDTD